MNDRDYATRKKVNTSKPEEVVRQRYEKILFEDYDYPVENIDIEVRIQRGKKSSQKNRKERADIVIYRDKEGRDQYKDIIGIVETKSSEKKDGLIQLTSYMSACDCQWGIWTNGEEIEFLYKDTNTGEIKRDYIFNIPKHGETIDSMGTYSKEKLRPVKNLKPIFKNILTALYSNTNISRREKLGNEMIKLIFSKIWDEKYNAGSLPNFRFEQPKNDDKEGTLLKSEYKKCADRVKELFNNVKDDLKGDGIFLESEGITLDDKSVAQVVGELEQFSLMKTEKDIIGEAFEIFAESKLAGEKGEFFTPREIVKIAVQILNPEPGKTIIDPACGSGGFLIYVLEHIWEKMKKHKKYRGMDKNAFSNERKRIAEKCIYGVDKEHDLVRIAKAYMSITGDGKSNIVQENILHHLEEYQKKPKNLLLENGELKQFDYVITNPPFGSKIKISKHDSKQFDLGYKWAKKNGAWEAKKGEGKERETPPQELFIERCLQLLKDGGKLAIVLPEIYFFSPQKAYILQYMIRNNNIISIIDLPHNMFRPYCNAKTCLIILEKNKPQQPKILMAVAEEMGHDHTGRAVYRIDKNSIPTQEIWDDTLLIRKEIEKNVREKYTFNILSENVKDVYVPRNYWGETLNNCKKQAEKAGFELVQTNELFKDKIIDSFSGYGSPPSEFKGIGEIPYVRVSDIINWEVFKNPNTLIPEHVYEKIKGTNGIGLKPEDILYIRRGSYRIGSVAMVSPLDTKILIMREIEVIRLVNKNNPYEITSYYLLYALSHKITQMQIKQKTFIDTTLPNIGSRWKDILIPIHKDKSRLEKTSNFIKDAVTKKWKANTILHKNITDIIM